MNKIEARKLCLNNRKELDVKSISKDVVNDIYNSCVLKNCKNIGIYYPLKYEIDITSLLDLYPDKVFYLPITTDELSFVRYDKKTVLKDGPFNTKEPVGNIINRDMIDCFFIPCVGINKYNKRIGYGKGYYDRYLGDYKGLKLGICYKNAYGLDVELDEFDLVLDKVFIGG